MSRSTAAITTTQMTFGLLYAFSERFILPLSHDEVVYGKHSLLGRMPGDHWQRFANLRAYLGFMWTHPGKKLLFMGGEFGQEREWNHDAQPDWDLLDDPAHRGVQRLVRDLNRLYTAEPALHARDCDDTGLPLGRRRRPRAERLRLSAACRAAMAPPVLAVSNFTPGPAPRLSAWRARGRDVARRAEHRRGLLRRLGFCRRRRRRRPSRRRGTTSRPRWR